MTYVKESLNEYGTPITEFTCETCGSPFSVCPAVNNTQHDQWKNCLALECESYDVGRDVEAILGFGWGSIHIGEVSEND